MLKKLFKSLRSPLRAACKPAPAARPKVLGPRQHSLHRGQFSRNAVSVVDRLQKAGYQAYLVGGCVRDLLIGVQPKDFDVATSATPEQVRAEFRNARVIGRRFKLVARALRPRDHRSGHLPQQSPAGRGRGRQPSVRTQRERSHPARQRLRLQESDAQRRDFTINALYYDPPANASWTMPMACTTSATA